MNFCRRIEMAWHVAGHHAGNRRVVKQRAGDCLLGYRPDCRFATHWSPLWSDDPSSFQRCGHKPLALIGGATGMIGDPSGKSAERNLLDEETLRHNQACIKNQLAKFLDFESDVPNRAELVNNYDWMKDFTFLDFVREVGKHITVNYMMAKDSVKRRLNGEARDGLSFTEFTYQLLQGYDFLHLYETKGCKLQMGGSDQWGNITTGAELIRPNQWGRGVRIDLPADYKG